MSPARTPWVGRFWRAALLRSEIYEEVEADPRSIGQAAVVVGLACTAAVLGTWIRIENGHPLPEGAPPLGAHLAIVALELALLWLVASAFAYMVGATFLRGPETETDYAEVLRTTGFAFAPGVLLLGVAIPSDDVAVGSWLVVRIWILVAAIVAVRQACDFDTLRAIGTFGVAALLLWLVLTGLTTAPMPV